MKIKKFTSFVETHLTCLLDGFAEFAIRGISFFLVDDNAIVFSLWLLRVTLVRGFILFIVFSTTEGGLWKTLLITILRLLCFCGCLLSLTNWIGIGDVNFFLDDKSLSNLNFCEYFKLLDVKARTNFSVSFCLRVCDDFKFDLIRWDSCGWVCWYV